METHDLHKSQADGSSEVNSADLHHEPSGDSELFASRKKDSADLLALVKANPAVVLHGGSGTGKTFLLKVGLVEKLRKEKKYLPVLIRFNFHTPNKETEPNSFLSQIKTCLNAAIRLGDWDLRPIEEHEELVTYFNSEIGENAPDIVLVFDQFEEFFIHGKDKGQSLFSALEKVLHTPSSETASHNADEEEKKHAKCHLVFSVRNDYLKALQSSISIPEEARFGIEHIFKNPEVTADNPFKGLFSYTEDESKLFASRKSETEQLKALVKYNSLTVLFGTSGTGKTSLLKAGLFAGLRKDNKRSNDDDGRLKQFVPVYVRLKFMGAGGLSTGTNLVGQIKRKINREVEERKRLKARRIEEEESIWEYFHTAFEENDIVPVLVLDQFEEVFTLGLNDHGVEKLISELASLIENQIPRDISERLEYDEDYEINVSSHNYRILLSLREDYLPQLFHFKIKIPSIDRVQFRLEQLDAQAAKKAILKPNKVFERTYLEGAQAESVIRFIRESQEKRKTGRNTLFNIGDGEAVEIDFANDRIKDINPAVLNLVCSELVKKKSPDTPIPDSWLRTKKLNEIIGDYYSAQLKHFPFWRRWKISRTIENKMLSNGLRIPVPLESLQQKLSGEEIQQLVKKHKLLRFERRLTDTSVELIHDFLATIIWDKRIERKKQFSVWIWLFGFVGGITALVVWSLASQKYEELQEVNRLYIQKEDSINNVLTTRSDSALLLISRAEEQADQIRASAQSQIDEAERNAAAKIAKAEYESDNLRKLALEIQRKADENEKEADRQRQLAIEEREAAVLARSQADVANQEALILRQEAQQYRLQLWALESSQVLTNTVDNPADPRAAFHFAYQAYKLDSTYQPNLDALIQAYNSKPFFGIDRSFARDSVGILHSTILPNGNSMKILTNGNGFIESIDGNMLSSPQRLFNVNRGKGLLLSFFRDRRSINSIIDVQVSASRKYFSIYNRLSDEIQLWKFNSANSGIDQVGNTITQAGSPKMAQTTDHFIYYTQGGLFQRLVLIDLEKGEELTSLQKSGSYEITDFNIGADAAGEPLMVVYRQKENGRNERVEIKTMSGRTIEKFFLNNILAMRFVPEVSAFLILYPDNCRIVGLDGKPKGRLQFDGIPQDAVIAGENVLIITDLGLNTVSLTNFSINPEEVDSIQTELSQTTLIERGPLQIMQVAGSSNVYLRNTENSSMQILQHESAVLSTTFFESYILTETARYRRIWLYNHQPIQNPSPATIVRHAEAQIVINPRFWSLLNKDPFLSLRE